MPSLSRQPRAFYGFITILLGPITIHNASRLLFCHDICIYGLWQARTKGNGIKKITFTLGQIENTLLKTQEIKTHRHFVKIRVFSIDDNCVWPPDGGQKGPVHWELTKGPGAVVVL